MTVHESTEVLVVGAGPIGIEMAAALKAAGVPHLQVEAGPIGRTITGYPQRTRFFSSPERIAICGVPLVTIDQQKATKEEYLAYLRGVIEQFDLKIRTYERVVALERGEAGFTVQTAGRHGMRVVDARRVVLAVGDMARTRRLGIPGEDLPHVTHTFDDPHAYFQREVVIVGGKNSAVEAALRCHRAGARVTMSYRGAAFPAKSVKYWLLPEVESFVKQGHIGFHPGTVPVEILDDEVILRRTADDTLVSVPADFVLLLIGYEADTSLFRMAGVTLEGENQGPRHDPDTMETDVPGVYVAGTAAAGTQHHFKLFIENSHVHVDRILAHVTGRPVVERVTRGFSLPES